MVDHCPLRNPVFRGPGSSVSGSVSRSGAAPGRRLELAEGCIRQYDDEELVARIDTTRPFEYRVVDRYEVDKALVRLYQGERQLSFYVSDPGGEEAMRNVVQVEWPPKSRHAGRSYPPSSGR